MMRVPPGGKGSSPDDDPPALNLSGRDEMRQGEIEVFIAEPDFGHEINIYIVQRGPDHDNILRYPEGGDKPGVWEKVTPGSICEPTWRLSRLGGMVVLEKIAEYMAKKKGWKPQSESKVEGKLESTLYHLEDLRKLMKLVK